MKVAYFILAVPKFVKKALLVSGLGFFAILPLYIFVRLYRKAIMTFNSDNVLMTGQNVNIIIPIRAISKVYCTDAKKINGEPKEKFVIHFQQKNGRSTRVRLSNYWQAEQVIHQMAQYEKIDFSFYDFDVSPVIDEEE
jgi:hypothetical protein